MENNSFDEYIRILKRVDKKLTALTSRTESKTWVTASVIQDLTGWENHNKLRWARENRLVEYKNKKYLLESVNKAFLRREVA